MRLKEFAKVSHQKGWLVKDLLPQGHSILGVGLPGTLKSWFVDGLAVHIAGGKDFLGLPVNHGPVILIDEDTPSDELYRRLKRLAEGLGLSSVDLPIEVHSMENIDLNDDESLQELIDEVTRIKPVLVILDCLSKVMGSDFNENTTRDANVAGSVWNRLKSTGATIFSTHHLNKREGDIATDFVKLSSGSHAIVANSDTAFGIEFGQHDPTRFNVTPKERRCKLGIREPFGIELEEDVEGSWARLKRIEFARQLSILAKDIYGIFRGEGEDKSLTANDVKSRLAGAASDSDMRDALSELEERGLLKHKRGGHNRYEYYRV
jgi:hypothetical protein